MVCGLIDLNTVNDKDETAMPSVSSVASDNFETTTMRAVCKELWHACAGPLISLPKKGGAVVYFPQGHMELLQEKAALSCNLPPHVFCRVIDVHLQADVVRDEVYAQVSLVTDRQIEQNWREGIVEAETETGDEDDEGMGKSRTPHMFCKTLTASDTSTHGGFSVPRRAAEDCFPPLDNKQQRPSQELVAKDLHGIVWKFRHIYRGQPRRHLLTTGWGAFVNRKQLLPGDAVLFLRGGDGELRLGTRRQVKNGVAINPSQQFSSISFAAITKAILTQSVFNICYNPRTGSSEIMIPYLKFSRSLSHSFSCGMRVRFGCEKEQSGVIVGVSDADALRWPGSKWKCVLVNWDSMEVNHINRVSPWEIEPTSSTMEANGFLPPSAKRCRLAFDLQATREIREARVLQGQEVYPCISEEALRIHQPVLKGYPRINYSRILTNHGDLGEFHKVLQGQETMPIQSYGREQKAYQQSRSQDHNQPKLSLARKPFNQKFVAMGKNNCRLFGSLISEGSVTAGTGEYVASLNYANE